MPVINIGLGAGQTSEEQKAWLIRRMASDAAEITGIPAGKFITFITELPMENIGIGTETLKEIQVGR